MQFFHHKEQINDISYKHNDGKQLILLRGGALVFKGGYDVEKKSKEYLFGQSNVLGCQKQQKSGNGE